MSLTRAGAHVCVAPITVPQRFAIEIAPVNEDTVRAKVCGERELVVWLGDDAVRVGRALPIGNWSAALVVDDRHRRRKRAIRLNWQERDTATVVVGNEHHAAAAVHTHVTRADAFGRLHA